MGEIVHTSCKKCIFAIYDDLKKTQVGCLFNKIEKLKVNGLSVIDSFDEEKEFYTIEGHACMTYREEGFLKDRTIDEAKDLARKQSSVRLGCLVLIKEINLENLENMINRICSQTKQFYEVIFCAEPKVSPRQIIKLLDSKKVSFKWSIRHVVDEDYSGNMSINLAMRKTDSTYMSVFDCSFNIPNTFVEEIDNSLNDDMQRFLVLEAVDDKDNGLTFQCFIFNALRGNEDAVLEDDPNHKMDSIVDKIKYVATSQLLTSMIKSCKEICPCMNDQGSP